MGYTTQSMLVRTSDASKKNLENSLDRQEVVTVRGIFTPSVAREQELLVDVINGIILPLSRIS